MFGRIVVKTYYEAAHHLHSVSLYRLDSFYQVHRTVLVLAAFRKAFFLRRLQPKKDSVKACRGHQSHEFLILGQVHRGFGVQHKWKIFGLLPGYDALRNVLTFDRFPMKLSSTTKRLPRQPMSYSISNSRIIWSFDFTLGRRPFRLTMSQNSQSYGHPLEY